MNLPQGFSTKQALETLQYQPKYFDMLKICRHKKRTICFLHGFSNMEYLHKSTRREYKLLEVWGPIF